MIDGLPLHPLLAHGAVVLLAVAGLAQVAAVLLPRFRAWLDWGLPVLGVATAVVVQVTASFGEELEDVVGETAAVEAHSEWGELATTTALLLAVAMVAHWSLTSPTVPRRWADRWPWLTSRPVVMAVAGVSVLVAVAAVVLDVLAGHSGATSVWG